MSAVVPCLLPAEKHASSHVFSSCFDCHDVLYWLDGITLTVHRVLCCTAGASPAHQHLPASCSHTPVSTPSSSSSSNTAATVGNRRAPPARGRAHAGLLPLPATACSRGPDPPCTRAEAASCTEAARHCADGSGCSCCSGTPASSHLRCRRCWCFNSRQEWRW